MIMGLLLIVSLLAVAYAAFTTGVACASNRQLRLVFVRVVALLGLVALGGACVSVLRAEAPADDEEAVSESDSSDEATEEAAEIVVEAFGTIDERFIERYTDLEQLLAVEDVVAESAADEVVELAVPTESETDALPFEDVATGAELLDDVESVGDEPEATFHVSISKAETPLWIEEPASFTGSGDHFSSVESGPWLTDVEAETALNEVILEAVADYVDDQVGQRDASRKIRISIRDIETYQIVQDRFADEFESSIGTMQRKHAKLVFTPAFRSEIAARWQQHLVTHRLVRTCVGVVAVMTLLFVSLGVFKRLGSAAR